MGVVSISRSQAVLSSSCWVENLHDCAILIKIVTYDGSSHVWLMPIITALRRWIESGGSGVQGYPLVYGEFQANLIYLRKKKN